MWLTSVFHPLLSLFVHAALIALWAVSIRNQAGADMSDSAHPQSGAPWYITKSCGPPVSPSLIGYCKQAKAAFAVTIIMTFVKSLLDFLTASDMLHSILFFAHLVITFISLYPNKSFRSARSSKYSDKEGAYQPYDMLEMPQTPGTTGGLKSPTTPRTTAFNTLSSKGKQPVRQGNKGIPLRHHIGMGDETYKGPSGR